MVCVWFVYGSCMLAFTFFQSRHFFLCLYRDRAPDRLILKTPEVVSLLYTEKWAADFTAGFLFQRPARSCSHQPDLPLQTAQLSKRTSVTCFCASQVCHDASRVMIANRAFSEPRPGRT